MMNLYVIGPEGGPYKVGKTNDLHKRRTALQTGNPLPLKVHFSITSTEADLTEKRAHDTLGTCRLSGEWFDAPLEEIIAAIEGAGAVVTAAPITMSGASFGDWLKEMKAQGIARSDAAAARLLGISANAVVQIKRKGADHRTALACRALFHRLEPWA